jgi:hypothetical protein
VPQGFHLEICKGKAATHICGSAYVDLLAEGRKQGFLSEFGRIAPDFPHAEQVIVPVGQASSLSDRQDGGPLTPPSPQGERVG